MSMTTVNVSLKKAEALISSALASAEYFDQLDKPSAARALRKEAEALQAAIAQPAEQPSEGDVHPEDFCDKCGGPNISWFAQNELWNKVTAGRHGIICPICFVKEAEEQGINYTWEVSPEIGNSQSEGDVGRDKFVPCDTYGPDHDTDNWVAGITHLRGADNGKDWYQRIEVYGDTKEAAEAMRDKIIAALNAATPPQEPVAWLHRQGNHTEVSERQLDDGELSRGWTQEPLYTHPPTNDEAVRLLRSIRNRLRGGNETGAAIVDAIDGFLATHKQEGK